MTEITVRRSVRAYGGPRGAAPAARRADGRDAAPARVDGAGALAAPPGAITRARVDLQRCSLPRREDRLRPVLLSYWAECPAWPTRGVSRDGGRARGLPPG